MDRYRCGALVVATFALLGILGCIEEKSLIAPDPDAIDVDHTDPAKVIVALEEALAKKDYDAYMALLSPDFTFYIRDDDASDLPWVVNGFWSREVEGEIIANMMDPNFNGGWTRPVDTIEATFDGLNVTPIEGGYRLVADADIRVLVGPDTGWFSDTKFECVLRPDARDFLRIETVREVRRTEPGRAAEESTWGQIKNLYR